MGKDRSRGSAEKPGGLTRVSAHNPEARLYGRGQGKPLSARQARLVEILFPKLALSETGEIDPASLFPGKIRFALEIGFGSGEHLLTQAEAAPNTGFIGAEPFLNGMAKALAGIEARGLSNIRLCRGDARRLLPRLKPASLDQIYLLFPDPWPKTRHHKRRFVQDDTARDLARCLKPGGCLRFASDVAHYQAWALAHVLRARAFDWTAERARDWRTAPEDHVTTRYEQKRLGDAPPVFLNFTRRPT